MTLKIEITNKDPKALRRLKEWIDGALGSWSKDRELPMKGTTWTSRIVEPRKRKSTECCGFRNLGAYLDQGT